MPLHNIQRIDTQFSEGDIKIKILLGPIACPKINPDDMASSKIKQEISTKNLNVLLSAVEDMDKQVVLIYILYVFIKYVEHT